MTKKISTDLNTLKICWKKFEDLKPFNLKFQEVENSSSAQVAVLLGEANGKIYFGVDITSALGDSQVQTLETKTTNEEQIFISGRELLFQPPNPAEMATLSQLFSRLTWHENTKFSSKTGKPLVSSSLGHRRSTVDHSEVVYPRINPVAIVLVLHPDGDKCLLCSTRRRVSQGVTFFSCLAGFVEQGESVEDAVRREVFEESGIKVGNEVELVGSQAWPIGAAGNTELMLACMATAESVEIDFDEKELSDCKWFHRQEIEDLLKASDSEEKVRNGIMIPPGFAVAHSLMKLWINTKASEKAAI
eukprot:augustus_masked-scaffold_31-processed-gene-0.35-mRNA-1 protein AED:0.15 eAED:0.16 QI:0/-1/0/1/-1/1/1/0/302